MPTNSMRARLQLVDNKKMVEIHLMDMLRETSLCDVFAISTLDSASEIVSTTSVLHSLYFSVLVKAPCKV